jgi:hypothetical protein
MTQATVSNGKIMPSPIENEAIMAMAQPKPDPVNHPPHYQTYKAKGIEVIDITEELNFNLGNVIKYVLRADHKENPGEDLAKALWYLKREIARREKQ